MLIPTKWISRKLKWITEVVIVSNKNLKKTTSHLLKSIDKTIFEYITLYSLKNSLLIKSPDMKNTWLSTIAKCLKNKLNTSFKKSNNKLKDIAAK